MSDRSSTRRHSVVLLEECGDDLLELCSLALPEENLTFDDVETVLFSGVGRDRSGVSAELGEPVIRSGASAVLAIFEDGRPVAAAGATTTLMGEHVGTHLEVLAVHPARRRRGLALRLVGEIERWAIARGSDALHVGGGAPFFLFTGVDSRWTEALCCFEAMGYTRVGVELDLVCPTVRAGARRFEQPEGLSVAGVADERDALELGEWVRRSYPHWAAEFDRGADAGTVALARVGSEVVGAAAHSVSRWGVVGPVAVDPEMQRGGVGAALMESVLGELAAAGLRQAEIAWTSTVRFYSRVCDARVGRSSVLLRKDLRRDG